MEVKLFWREEEMWKSIRGVAAKFKVIESSFWADGIVKEFFRSCVKIRGG